MWSNPGGGGFNTSYGGDDGGMSQFNSPSQEPRRAQGRKIQNVLPLTVRTVLQMEENTQQYCGTDVNMIELVGLIRTVDVTSTKITYNLDDSSGTIPVIKWIEKENSEEETLMENTYCRVHGTFKTHQGVKQLLAVHLEPVTDFNNITTHMLEVVHAALQLQRLQTEPGKGSFGAGPGAGPSLSNSMVGMDTFGGGGSFTGMQGLSGNQNLVFQIISSSTDDPGTSRERIKSKLQGSVSRQQVDEVLNFLSSEGHIYTTVDEDHFKATDG